MAINEDEASTLPRPITSQYYLDHLAQPEEIVVQVTEHDFDQALAELIPSVSAQELEHYKQVQKMFNSDDFAKEAEAAAAAEAEKGRIKKEQMDERELAEALRKVEEAQNLISAEGHHQHGQRGQQEVADDGYIDAGNTMGKGKGKGKGRSQEYSHVVSHEQEVSQSHEENTSAVEEEITGGGLEEPLMIGEQDREAIEEAQQQGGSGGRKGKGKSNKGKGRK